jgi:hypothetical protein
MNFTENTLIFLCKLKRKTYIFIVKVEDGWGNIIISSSGWQARHTFFLV